MKTFKIFFCLIIVAVSFCSCFVDSSSKLDYLPAKMDDKDDWGFVNSKGELSCQDQFHNLPSAVVEGVFSVQENDAFVLYKYDPKKPKVLFEDLADVGAPSGGILPITRKDNHIEIVSVEGKVLYELAEVEGMPVVLCEASFVDSKLIVQLVASDGENMFALVDNTGKTLIKPFKGEGLYRINSDLYIMFMRDKDEKTRFVNAKGEKQSQWNPDYDYRNVFDGYVVFRKDERYFIYNSKGEEVLKCSDKVNNIIAIKKNFFVYYKDSGYGVMNLKGEKILSDKYSDIIILDNGFLAQKDADRDYEFFNKNGESEYKIDYKHITEVPGFGLVAQDGRDYVILDSQFKPAGKTELESISVGRMSNEVYSDYFDYSAVCSSVSSLLSQGLNSKGFIIGKKLKNLSVITSKDKDSFGHYSTEYSEKIAVGNKYNISATLYFDDYIVKPKYENKTVQKYSYWYGYYNDTERKLVGYFFNNDASIKKVRLTLDVPSSKVDKLMRQIRETLDGKFTKTDEDVYSNGSQIFTIEESYGDVYVTISKADNSAVAEEAVEVIEEEIEYADVY